MNNGNHEQENPYSQTEKQKSEDRLLILIQELTKLIKQEKEKGKTAWETGKMLSELKKQRLAKVKHPDSPDSVKSFEANFDEDF